MIILAWINNLPINRDHFLHSRFPSYTTSLSCLWHIHMDIISYLYWYACDNYTSTLPVKYRDHLPHSRLIITIPVRHTYTSRTMTSVLLCQISTLCHQLLINTSDTLVSHLCWYGYYIHSTLTAVQSYSYFLNTEITSAAPDFQPSRNVFFLDPRKYLSLAQQ